MNHVFLVRVAGEVALPYSTGHRQSVAAIFRYRRPKILQFVELLLLPRSNSGPCCDGCWACGFHDGDRPLSHGALRIVTVGHLAAAEVATEEDAERWCGSAHDSHLQLELSPDEEHEGGPDDVS
jgi:hypothetical protein